MPTMETVEWIDEMGNHSEIITSVFLRLAIQHESDNQRNFDINGWEVFKGIGRMFYIVDPAETTYARLEDVPHIFRNVSAYVLIETAIKINRFNLLVFRPTLIYQKKKNDNSYSYLKCIKVNVNGIIKMLSFVKRLL